MWTAQGTCVYFDGRQIDVKDFPDPEGLASRIAMAMNGGAAFYQLGLERAARLMEEFETHCDLLDYDDRLRADQFEHNAKCIRALKEEPMI